MRRLFTKIGSLAAAAMLALTAAQPAEAGPVQRPAAETAYFEFTDISRETAVFQLTDPVKIEKARKILSGEETYETHVVGRIVKRPAPYNPTWSFHFSPETISFFESAIEVCDATLPYVEDHLDEAGGAFLPGGYWCPWTSELVREVPAP
ncbi:calmodulin-binding protein [Streptomyces spiramyceticus]|uniref:BP74-related protein n=1 Tax=Streptomyces spiramyceticus TaxID=299717 RepID=UPI00237A7622|nr:calmodulin-binding protein [Streptomyces spiramyceticus]